MKKITFIMSLFLFFSVSVNAEENLLKNGDFESEISQEDYFDFEGTTTCPLLIPDWDPVPEDSIKDNTFNNARSPFEPRVGIDRWNGFPTVEQHVELDFQLEDNYQFLRIQTYAWNSWADTGLCQTIPLVSGGTYSISFLYRISNIASKPTPPFIKIFEGFDYEEYKNLTTPADSAQYRDNCLKFTYDLVNNHDGAWYEDSFEFTSTNASPTTIYVGQASTFDLGNLNCWVDFDNIVLKKVEGSGLNDAKLNKNNIKYSINGSMVSLSNIESIKVSIYSITGALVKSVKADAGKASFSLDKGLYIIKDGEKGSVLKLIIK